MSKLHLHLVSDSTGETSRTVARAALVQFQHVEVVEHLWSMVRSRVQVDEAIAGIKENPGFVLYTLVNMEVRKLFEQACEDLDVPMASPLIPVITKLANYLGEQALANPGRQHVMNEEYFRRIDAMHYVLDHDDGQARHNLEEADVILLGVSRTSKTPTCMYLANRGLKAANVPLVPGVPLPHEVMAARKPLIVGLTSDPRRLIELRRARMRMMQKSEESDYTDMDSIVREMTEARKLFAEKGWPTIDVTRRSVEETAATILQLHARRQDAQGTPT
jgi:regulator of PEP synthase PpsR (kinase-PPPase family)